MDDKSGGRRRGLGMGLSALLETPPGSPEEAFRTGQWRKVPIERLHPSPLQPRVSFPEAELDTLAQSLGRHGLLQPLLVRARRGADGFEIVAGERRWRAAQRAGLHELPVVVRELEDRDVVEMTLVENLQRQDLDPIEEATAFQRLIDEHGFTQEAVARLVGKSRPHVANTLRLLALPADLRGLVVDGTITAGHARALLASKAPRVLAARIAAEGLSVRQAEALATAAAKPARRAPVADPDTADLEHRLAQRLGLKIRLRRGRRGGALLIRFSSADQLDDLAAMLLSGG